MKKRIVVLGATGSIGESAMRVARELSDKMEVLGLSGKNNVNRLLQLAREFPEAQLCAGDVPSAEDLSRKLGRPVLHGAEGLESLAELPDADLVMVAIVGTAGLKPALRALGADKDLAVASKEILVMAGELVMETARRSGRRVLPVDSEHNAIFQCLEGQDPSAVKRLILTCSGGPFRNAKSAADLAAVSPEQALRHPTWSMGKKISIDSATLFNKGLEMIEARWLFDIPMEKIDVVIHPQSIVHSMVEFVDGSILAQMSSTDMALPIQYALTYPERFAGPCAPLDLTTVGRLDFESPRTDLFPSLDLARRAGTAGGTLPAVLNAANEAAVEAFLAGRLSFPGIWQHVARAMDEVPFVEHPTLDQLILADRAAREIVFH